VNYITPVRDQGQCGSCWAFGAIGSVEGTYNFEQGKSSDIDLSEQDIVSCDTNGNEGCNGGWSSNVIDYLKSTNVCDETCFPYRAQDMSCSQRCAWNKAGWKVTSDERPSTVEAAKARLVCGGPIAVCSPTWGHCITLIAYDDDSSVCQTQYGSKGCWIIKNSWGSFNGVDQYCGVYHQNGYGYIPYTGQGCSDIVQGSQGNDLPDGPIGIIAP
jgi:C1A family cysteine protease